MDNNWISLLQNQNQLSKVIETNQYTEQFSLIENSELSPEKAYDIGAKCVEKKTKNTL